MRPEELAQVLARWRESVNTIAATTSKTDRYRAAIALKAEMRELAEAITFEASPHTNSRQRVDL